MRVEIPISEGIKFNTRGADNQRFINASYDAKLGVVATARNHALRFVIPEHLRHMVGRTETGILYSYSAAGNIYSNNTIIDSGYNPVGGTLLLLPARDGIQPPTISLPKRDLFIAGGNKMSRYDGTRFTTWGIDAPPASPLSVRTIASPEEFLWSNCDNIAEWVAGGATIAIDTATKLQGIGSLKVTLAPNARATVFVTKSFGNGGLAPIIKFDVQIDNPATLKLFVMAFAIRLQDGSSILVYKTFTGDYQPQFPPPLEETDNTITGGEEEESGGEGDTNVTDASATRTDTLPSVGGMWKRVIVNITEFNIGGPRDVIYQGVEFNAVGFVMSSSTANVVRIDRIVATFKNQDDSNGARYKYAYANSKTGHLSNLNATPSAAISGFNDPVLVTGFVPGPVASGVDAIVLFRDVGSDGNYRAISAAVPTTSQIIDNVPIERLQWDDTNNHAPPPRATQAIEYKGSVWLNDTTNPRRVWRSVPGEYESFSLQANSGFFSISGSEGDEVVALAVVRGQLYILTHYSILQVLNPTDVPIFAKIANLGLVTNYSHFSTKDFLIFTSYTGIYIFDGAEVRPLPDINALFNLHTTHVDAVRGNNIGTVRIGSDTKYIWVTYNNQLGQPIMFTYNIEEKKWTQDFTPMTGHEEDQTSVEHSASNGGAVFRMYSAPSFAFFVVTTREIELNRISFIYSIGLEHKSNSAIKVNIILNGIVIKAVTLPSSPTVRKWSFITLPSNTIGQFLQLVIGSTSGYTEIYSAYAEIKEIEDTVYYDTGYVTLGNDKVSIDELDFTGFVLESGNLTLTIKVDNVTVFSLAGGVQAGIFYIPRQALTDVKGLVVRVELFGVRFFITSMYLQLTDLGNGQQRHFPLIGG